VSLGFPIPRFGHLRSPRAQPGRWIVPRRRSVKNVAWTIQQPLRRDRPPEFSLNHGLIWLMIGYFRDQLSRLAVCPRFSPKAPRRHLGTVKSSLA
jgi:hypothetical protein